MPPPEDSTTSERIELAKLEIERERLKAENAAREAARQQPGDVERNKTNADLKKSKLTEFLFSPAVIIAIVGVFGTVAGYFTQAYLNRDLEQRKFEYEAIKLALQQPTDKDKTDFLILLRRWKIITTLNLSEKEIQDLSNKGQLPTVRPSTELQRPNESQRSIAAACATAAQRFGVDLPYLLALGWMESGLRSNVTSPMSSAFGVFQLLQPIWNEFLSTQGKADNLTDADKFSAKAQCLAGAHLVSRYASTLKTALGKDPTAVELYLAHVFGPATAIAIAKADPTAPLPASISRLTSSLRGEQGPPRNTKDLLDWVAARLQRALTATADVLTQAAADAAAPAGKGN